MLKLILSIIVGLVAAFALVFASDALFHALVPSAPVPDDPNDRVAMAAYVAGQPTGVLVGLALGWAVAALVGAAIAARFAARGASPGWVVGGVFLIATASNFLMIPHPAWMVAIAVAAIVAATWSGSRLGARGSRPTTA